MAEEEELSTSAAAAATSSAAAAAVDPATGLPDWHNLPHKTHPHHHLHRQTVEFLPGLQPPPDGAGQDGDVEGKELGGDTHADQSTATHLVSGGNGRPQYTEEELRTLLHEVDAAMHVLATQGIEGVQALCGDNGAADTAARPKHNKTDRVTRGKRSKRPRRRGHEPRTWLEENHVEDDSMADPHRRPPPADDRNASSGAQSPGHIVHSTMRRSRRPGHQPQQVKQIRSKAERVLFGDDPLPGTGSTATKTVQSDRDHTAGSGATVLHRQAQDRGTTISSRNVSQDDDGGQRGRSTERIVGSRSRSRTRSPSPSRSRSRSPSPQRTGSQNEGACGSCGKLVPRVLLSRHKTHECAARNVPCPNGQFGCNAWVALNTLHDHLNLSCSVERLKERMASRANARREEVQCAGCGQSVQLMILGRHEREECENRKVPCRNWEVGCRSMVRLRDRHAHEDAKQVLRPRVCMAWSGTGAALLLDEDARVRGAQTPPTTAAQTAQRAAAPGPSSRGDDAAVNKGGGANENAREGAPVSNTSAITQQGVDASDGKRDDEDGPVDWLLPPPWTVEFFVWKVPNVEATRMWMRRAVHAYAQFREACNREWEVQASIAEVEHALGEAAQRAARTKDPTDIAQKDACKRAVVRIAADYEERVIRASVQAFYAKDATQQARRLVDECNFAGMDLNEYWPVPETDDDGDGDSEGESNGEGNGEVEVNPEQDEEGIPAIASQDAKSVTAEEAPTVRREADTETGVETKEKPKVAEEQGYPDEQAVDGNDGGLGRNCTPKRDFPEDTLPHEPELVVLRELLSKAPSSANVAAGNGMDEQLGGADLPPDPLHSWSEDAPERVKSVVSDGIHCISWEMVAGAVPLLERRLDADVAESARKREKVGLGGATSGERPGGAAEDSGRGKGKKKRKKGAKGRNKGKKKNKQKNGADDDNEDGDDDDDDEGDGENNNRGKGGSSKDDLKAQRRAAREKARGGLQYRIKEATTGIGGGDVVASAPSVVVSLDYGQNGGVAVCLPKQETIAFDGVVPRNRWSHVAMVCTTEPKPHTVLYINGVPVDKKEGKTFSWPLNMIGGRNSALYGCIQEVRYWGNARSGEEIRGFSHKLLPLPDSVREAALLGWWTFEEGHGSLYVNDVTEQRYRSRMCGRDWSWVYAEERTGDIPPTPSFRESHVCAVELRRERLAKAGRSLEQPIPCPAGCGENVRKKDTRFHLQYQCLLRTEPCPGCGTELRSMDQANHILVECPATIHRNDMAIKGRSRLETVACNMCEETMSAGALVKHQKDECRFRTVFCPNPGCGHEVVSSRLDTHLRFFCQSPRALRAWEMAHRARERRGEQGWRRPWVEPVPTMEDVENAAMHRK